MVVEDPKTWDQTTYVNGGWTTGSRVGLAAIDRFSGQTVSAAFALCDYDL
jgi:hypothetical protein